MPPRRARGARLVGLVVVLLALGSVLIGYITPPERRFPPFALLPPASGDPVHWPAGGFAEGAVPPGLDRSDLPRGIPLYGSWLGSDSSVGATLSPWYRSDGPFSVMVAGYPGLSGNSLRVEVKREDQSVTVVSLDELNPGEVWVVRRVPVGRGQAPVQVRIVATDGHQGPRGWLAFSPPLVVRPSPATDLLAILRIVLTTVTSIVLVLGPGLALRATLGERPGAWLTFVSIPVLGISLLALGGLGAWSLAWVLRPRITVTGFALPLLLWFLLIARRTALAELLSPFERRTLGLFVVVVLIAVAKASYAPGPPGELYGGTVSRTLEVGDRSDSRIPFHVVQLVAHGNSPYGPVGSGYFAPWSFSHRGPLAGLAASPLVLLAGARVPRSMPDQPWVPFDPEGFAAYRIAMSVMAGTVVLVLFGLGAALVSREAGLFAATLASLTPFVVHEVFFTWPKLHAALYVLAAVEMVVRDRPGWAGLLLGVGYLFHPVALFSAPVLGIFYALRPQPRSGVDSDPRAPGCGSAPTAGQRPTVMGGVGMILALGLVLLGWRTVNGSHFRQGDFLGYLAMVDGHGADSAWAWLTGRAVSVANTLIPGYLFVVRSAHPSVNSILGRSPDVVVFFIQYWATAPFGLGIAACGLLLVPLWRGARRCPVVFAVAIVLPIAMFSVYWGAAPTGMMREGLHVWTLSVLLFVTWSWMVGEGAVGRPKWQSLLLASRAGEIGLMLLAPTLATLGTVVSDPFRNTDAVMVAAMVLGSGWLGWRGYGIVRSPVTGGS